MLASSPAYIKCYQCKKGPKKFTFLLCNHIICQKCITKNIEITDKYNLVKCSCGCLTYFNEQNEMISEKQKKELLNKRQADNGKQSNHKTSTDQRNQSRSNPIIDHYSKVLTKKKSTLPILEVSEVFSLQRSESQQNTNFQSFSPRKHKYLSGGPLQNNLRSKLSNTQKTNFEESLLLDNFYNFQKSKNQQNLQKSKKYQNSKAINQFSTHFVPEKASINPFYNPNSLKIAKSIKQSIIITNEKRSKQRSLKSAKSKEENFTFHRQFQNEIDFLRILFEKDLEQIQFQFGKVVKNLKKMFKVLEQNIKSLYVEEVITNQSILSLKLSQLVKKKYDVSMAPKFKILKDQLFLPFYNYKHNQNLFSYKSPVDSPFLHNGNLYTMPISPKNNSLNSSQIIEQSDSDGQKQTTKNNKIKKFETVEQKLERLTTKQDRKEMKNIKNNLNPAKEDNSKRIKTENIHTNIKRGGSINLRQKERFEYQNSLRDNHSPEPYYRLTQKPQIKHKYLNTQNPTESKRKELIYFSPPFAYCQKHLHKKQKQAKNYIGYIQKLCHEKKMKNHQELFKKVKQGQTYEFRNRD